MEAHERSRSAFDRWLNAEVFIKADRQGTLHVLRCNRLETHSARQHRLAVAIGWRNHEPPPVKPLVWADQARASGYGARESRSEELPVYDRQRAR